jgi:hypothetical protein
MLSLEVDRNQCRYALCVQRQLVVPDVLGVIQQPYRLCVGP